jgi:hypothetical protein
MTIVVTSNRPAELKAEPVKVDESKEALSALADTTAEQKTSEDSEISETQAKEETDTDDAEGDESEESGEAADADEEAKEGKPKRKSGWQRRIDKLNARERAAQKEAEYWKRRALEGAGETQKDAPKDEKPKQDAQGKPKPDQYETHEEYVEALTDWKLEQRDKAREAKARETELQTAQQKLAQAHIERVQAFAKKVDDFEEVVEAASDIVVSPALREAVLQSDNSAELIYELAKNRAEFERINALSPLAAARALGAFESRIAASKAKEEQKPEPKKQTLTPKPIAPVGGGKGAVAKSIDDPSLTQAEYEALRRKQMKQRAASW